LPLSEGRYLAFLLVDAARLQRTVFDRRVRKLGFTRTQWLVLRRLGEQLEKYGWLERRPDGSDRRINRIFMTELGRKIHDRIGPIAEAMVEEELSGLSRQEREQLTDLLLNVKRRLQEMASENEPIESAGLERENV